MRTRVTCDQCRQRRIRCNGATPCSRCVTSMLICKREMGSKRPGPKAGKGSVIAKLRKATDVFSSDSPLQENLSPSGLRQDANQIPWPSTSYLPIRRPDDEMLSLEGNHRSFAARSVSDTANSAFCNPSRPTRFTGVIESQVGRDQVEIRNWILGTISHQRNEPSTASWDTRSCEDGRRAHPQTQSPFPDVSLLLLITRCIEIYIEHLFPTMPVLEPSQLRQLAQRPREAKEDSLIYALCAFSITNMCGKSASTFGIEKWELVAQYLIRESIATRQYYNHIEDCSLFSILTSFFISSVHFQMNQSHLSWFYLREAITLAQGVGIDKESFYHGMDPLADLYYRRTFYILLVSERSFAIMRHKPILLSQTISPPEVIIKEQHEVDPGFRQLIRTFSQLSEGFIALWNESDTGICIPSTELEHLQNHFELSPDDIGPLFDTQKADLIVTQHWLRLVAWKTALRHGRLSSNSRSRSTTFSYPEQVAHSLLSALSALPSLSIEVHGMGIFEKVFELGSSLIDIISCFAKVRLDRPPSVRSNVEGFHAIVRIISISPNAWQKYGSYLESRASEPILYYVGAYTLSMHLPLPMDDYEVRTYNEYSETE
ncbi:hypothetical protein ASPWEDRAFT_169342 [Aspergillus wentii DTO 134E9]|uniref:Zn(2)-C6 fungal-type domain-containing protein n=1 Tax=Aspergillus wentii DTO 134E9 TaxID=1073089 RepID=A0A1L9RX23_ASPWE|nr:uncharacterized protein ASPWEDRAFT_169342 [Aspergillus wentii DTO 134E9]OJJ39501.1 hypothetical protein ASPWEDRAFT_169342 [Aspergillus wentii DTO 134E9]